jgi:hypothetical protein
MPVQMRATSPVLPPWPSSLTLRVSSSFLKGESPKLTRTIGHVIACPYESYFSWSATMAKFANFKRTVSSFLTYQNPVRIELCLMYCIGMISKFANFKSKWFLKKESPNLLGTCNCRLTYAVLMRASTQELPPWPTLLILRVSSFIFLF